jgi:DNA-binding NtrC family response regulator
VRSRSVLLASADDSFRQRVQSVLAGLRWHVSAAATGAEAWAQADREVPEVIVVDDWLPDLDLREFLREFCAAFPRVDVVTAEQVSGVQTPRSPYRQEVLYAMRSSEDTAPADTAAWNTAREMQVKVINEGRKPVASVRPDVAAQVVRQSRGSASAPAVRDGSAGERLSELVGNAACMLDVSRRVRLVAARNTPVLIEGPTGSGKELVAEALHRLSTRGRKPFLAINCAAIPEALLEAELFGHTRGAFTGAVQGRTGRIEAANGGTLFLDEIGEMPLALQAKLLRFVECGEIQRVGDNEVVKVDVRIIAATHRQLGRRTQEGTFRADLYYRLAVFLIRTPALADHMEDLTLLVDHFLEKMGRTEPVKSIGVGALARLGEHTWPGNVRELEHVLERAAILAEESETISAEDVDFGTTWD